MDPFGFTLLFHPVISESHAYIGEIEYRIEYRLHKSDSTYLLDLDVARAGHLAARNAKTRLAKDPSNPSESARGSFNIGIGTARRSFEREVNPF
ncbi:hypothetical protein F5Y11DRAFT_290470 [Daldinia sp. FL1419]|nr:hypothetical protein F5Y11DRAFT_290470 [Daldinia sp. FL1419]